MPKKIAWGGIDPGQKGQVCLLTENEIRFYKWHGETRSAHNLEKRNQEFNIKFCLEQIDDVRKPGFNVPGKLLVNYGFWRGVLTSNHCNWVSKTPRQWQTIMPDSSKKWKCKKDRSLFWAKEFYPVIKGILIQKKDHDRSDPLLMAHFLRQTEI